jgi:C-terminal processing protease CtpA/Prc
VPGKKFTGKAVYVLTSGRTFSAAEEFSYDLKSLKRATLLGETTGGGAHTTAPHRVDGHFFIRVPFGRFINPITKTAWEGTGVEPDIKVPAGDALDEALRRARSGL